MLRMEARDDTKNYKNQISWSILTSNTANI